MTQTIFSASALPARKNRYACWLLSFVLFVLAEAAFAQFLDQGAITGIVQDNTGAAIPNAVVKLESPDTGLTLTSTTDSSGVYVFSPVKIGNYTVSASAPGFELLINNNITLSQGQRLNVPLELKLGAVSQTVTVSDAPPLLQTQDSTVGQVLTSKEINDTPLNGRNIVYLAQLTAGVAPATGSRATNTGDFDANGMRPEQNNFVLDGVDNNAVTVDYLSNTSYLINPPPDALAEFKVSTSDYSAEFGHSAGGVVSASIKAGTNKIHGDLWEYWRNDILNSHDWVTPTIKKGEYRQNQFGATLGGPVLKNKLFFFGDVQANRIIINQAQSPLSVPTPLMRQGNFSELLLPALTSGGAAIKLYEPQNNQTPLTCNGMQNVLCANQIDPLAQKLLNMFPLPNANNGAVYNNYSYSLKQPVNTFQWDTRMDLNIRSKDQGFARFSYGNTRGLFPAPLGPILDGGGGNGSTNASGNIVNFANNFVLSETHIFGPKLVNELRFAFDHDHFNVEQLNSTTNISQTLGLGGVPYFPSNGGLPNFSVSGISGFGSRSYRPESESENEYQILENVSWTLGNHSLQLGFAYQSIRSYTLEPPSSRPSYTFNGSLTARPGIANTGYGVADFLTDNMSNGTIGPFAAFNNAQNIPSAYVQDDWKLSRKLTLNLGVRYDYFQPYKEMAGRQANFVVTTVGVSTGTGFYFLPAESRNKITLNPAFPAFLAKNNINLIYDQNPRLTKAQRLNFAPRLGFAYTAVPKTVVRGGFGMFYQGQQNVGAADDLGFNYPFLFSNTFPAPSCTTGSTSCANNGYTLETGFSAAIAQGLTSYFNTPTLVGTDRNIKSTYAMDYNLTLEQAISNNFVATIAYVGNVARHLPINLNGNSTTVLIPSGTIQNYLPFPGFGTSGTSNSSANILYNGFSTYNGLQTKLQKRITHGLDFLTTYTWSHALTDAGDPLSGSSLGSYRAPYIIPIHQDYSNVGWDIRHRLTFNGFYRLPIGRGEAYLSHSSYLVESVLGGWSTNITYQLQSGSPFSVGTANISTAVGGSAFPIMVRNPLAPGGTPDPSNPNITCPTSVRNKAHWFNPCAFRNPLPASAMPGNVTDAATAKLFLGGLSNTVYGPGYQRLDMSLFKHFRTFEDQYLEVRADGFNMLNTPAYANPTTTNIGQTGGLIGQTARTVQSYTPNSRFFQLAAKYVF